MRSFPRFFLALAAVLLSSVCFAQNSGAPVNHLNTAVTLSFSNASYKLAWTSHPSPQYYKQEYLPAGETAQRFKSMLLLEVLAARVNVKDIVAAKTAELQQMKLSNPYISFKSEYDAAKDEYILDFVLTAATADGKDIDIAERNIYRYKKYTCKNGDQGVLLFGLSLRHYGNEAKKFLAATGSNKAELINKVKQFIIPTVAIKN